MYRSLLSRLGAGTVAAAVIVGGSLLAAAPASAADPNTITVANTAFQSGAGWGDGLAVTGVTFPATTEVTLTAGVGNGSSGDSWGETTVTTDGDGGFATTFVPEFGPYDVPDGSTAFVDASYVDPDTGETIFSNLVELQIAAFVAAPASTTIVPSCLGADAAASAGVVASGTGFGQFEEGVLVSVTDAAGVNFGDLQQYDADSTGTVTVSSQLFTSLGLIPDGNYTIAFSSTVTGLVTSGTFKVGDCTVPATVVASGPTEPVAAAPSAAVLANTGSSDAGVLVGGSAALLIAGAALLMALRRKNATA